MLSVWAEALTASLAALGTRRLAGLGCAMPSPFDYAEGVARFEPGQKYEKLNGSMVGAELRHALHLEASLPVLFINDATAFSVAEVWVGAAAGYTKVVGVTLGTGFGTAFMCGGLPVIHGESVPPRGCLWEQPYDSGIADECFSTRGFVGEYQRISGRSVSGVRAMSDRAKGGDDAAMVCFRVMGRRLSELLAPWLVRFSAEAVVFGGNISRAYDLWGPAFEHGFEEAAPGVDVLCGKLHEDAGVIGAARVLEPEYRRQIEPLISLM